MSNMMEYKGYYGSIHYSSEDDVLYGKLEGIKGLITYEGTTLQELKEGFHLMVDEYLEDCKARNIKPETPFKGSFNVRVGSELHCKVAMKAEQENKSLNKVVAEALEKYVA